MTENSVENRRYVSYRPEQAQESRPHRIRHPEWPYYVGFIVVHESGEALRLRPGNVGLVSGGGCQPPEDAFQFGRERDARQFAEAHLSADIDWIFEPVARSAPPAWSAAIPPGHVPEEREP